MDGLTIGTVTARNVRDSGLLLNDTINATIGTVDAENAGAGTGYAAFRVANRNGRIGNSYPTNIRVGTGPRAGRRPRHLLRLGERRPGIDRVDIANTGNNAILVENCYNVTIAARAARVRAAARSGSRHARSSPTTRTSSSRT